MLWDWAREALKLGLCCTCLRSKSLDRTGKSLAGDALSMANSTLTQPMRLKLFATVTILVTASIAAFAQVDEPDNEAPPTIEDVQKLVQTISGDKAKLKAYCELGNLYERVEKAEEKNDMKELGALGSAAVPHSLEFSPVASVTLGVQTSVLLQSLYALRER